MIDLRSDTVTKPTEEMRKAMYEAIVGDDVYEEDPTVNELENLAAKMLGKEAALFVTSGTQGNQVAVITLCRPGNEVIVEENAHLFFYEGAAMSAFAGVQPRTLSGVDGAFTTEQLQGAIRSDDIHFPETGLICLENTHNRAGGAVISVEKMKSLYEIAQQHRIPLHLDGARLFNAAVALQVDVRELTMYCDTVQVCLSKGLGSPIGSILAGSRDFINRARKTRKRLGGGWRQAGILAAAGIVSLTKMVDRLSEDHAKAQVLAEGLSVIPELQVVNKVETNIVFIDVTRTGLSASEFVDRLKVNRILISAFGPKTVRFTTHYDVSMEQIYDALKTIQFALKSVITY